MTSTRIRDAALALEGGRAQEAVLILEDILRDNSKDGDALVCLGMAYLQMGNPAEAVDALRRAENVGEDNCVLALVMGRALKAIGEFDDSETYLRRAIRLDPDQHEAWSDLCKVLYVKADYSHAAGALRQAIAHFPDNITLHSLYAMCLYRMGDYDGAAEVWESVHRLQPDSIVAISNHAYALLIQGKVDEAMPLIERARSVDSDHYRTLILLGEVEFQRGRRSEAAAYFRRVLEQDPTKVEALGRLAILSQLEGNKRNCRKYLEMAKRSIGNDPEGWQKLFDVYQRLGWHKELMDCLISGARDDSGAAAVWIALAKEYDRDGQSQLALDAWMVSFRLRGYVKIHCPHCGHDSRGLYLENVRFDPREEQICPWCKKAIPMPEGLAPY